MEMLNLGVNTDVEVIPAAMKVRCVCSAGMSMC